MRQFIVVCFDVCDERRRRRVANELENFGVRVQRSVFECWLEDSELAELKIRLLNLVDKTEDQVRYYTLCPKDIASIALDGDGKVTSEPDYHLF